MAFDVIITERDSIYYYSIPAGTLFSTVKNKETYYLKLADRHTFSDHDTCVNIRTGEVDVFSPTTDCIVYTQSELKLTK